VIDTETVRAFADLSLIAPLMRALEEEGYTIPTPIQAATIPPALDGRDIVGCAQTGTGKTAAFVLPLLQRLAAERRGDAPAPGSSKQRGGVRAPIRALILTPTRELASQIGESIAAYGRHLRISHTIIFGGVSQHPQVKALARGVDIVIATPGRLLDLMEQRHVHLDQVGTFILDEADRMLDMGFIAPIRRIAATLPRRRQTMLFSATMPGPIAELAETLLQNPVRVAVTPVASTVDRIAQSLIMVGRAHKQARLESLLKEHDIRRAVVFTKTKHGADRVTRKLEQAGISATAIHGNKAQNQRERALASFRNGRVRILVATDVAARGLDVDDISHVFNFDLPMEPEAYVHRIGRTARAGAEGIAISFCDPCPSSGETDLLRQIHKLLRISIPSHDGTPTPTFDPSHADGHGAPALRGRGGNRGGGGGGGRSGGRPSGRATGRPASGANSRGDTHPKHGDRPVRGGTGRPSGRDGGSSRSGSSAPAAPNAPANGRGGAGGWARGKVRGRSSAR